MTQEVCIVSAVRTPIGSFLGALSSLTAPQLGAKAIAAAVDKAGINKDQIDEVIMGNVLTAAVGQAPARQAAIFAGLPKHVPCTTIGKVCGSGLKSVMMASQAIRCGDANVVVAGGMESMSNAPHAMQMRQGQKLGHTKITDTLLHDGLWDVYNDFHMGQAGELCAKEKNISREQQDAYAKSSYERAQKASNDGLFKDEIIPIEIQQRKETFIIDRDEDIDKARFDKFATLRPAFDKEGTVTAANASNINDGAAAVVLASKAWCEKNNIPYMAVIQGSTQAAREPEWFTMAPADAVEALHKKLSWTKDDVDSYEINEAFSLVSLAVSEQLGLDMSKVNPRGGAVAMGHPIGASGSRILVTLLHHLKQNKLKKGIASLCIGGGEAVALAVQI
ncbi:MAG TPA: acetyl-CoA C-acyltransferase [Oligoflexia bacterium]|nr:acetyl-CoA C-acyltransferase [Oligoflexia bacterium]HMR24995.1 acetyl-CoA C-acyltransferase [Oligoflexia bacterium]